MVGAGIHDDADRLALRVRPLGEALARRRRRPIVQLTAQDEQRRDRTIGAGPGARRALGIKGDRGGEAVPRAGGCAGVGGDVRVHRRQHRPAAVRIADETDAAGHHVGPVFETSQRRVRVAGARLGPHLTALAAHALGIAAVGEAVGDRHHVAHARQAPRPILHVARAGHHAAAAVQPDDGGKGPGAVGPHDPHGDGRSLTLRHRRQSDRFAQVAAGDEQRDDRPDARTHAVRIDSHA